MIGWVHEDCRAWARHKNWLETDENIGHKPLSMLGKLIREGYGAGQGNPSDRAPLPPDPPSYTLVNLAMRKMADTHEMEMPYRVVELHYLYSGRAKVKAPILKISVQQYWNQLHAAHAFIAACAVPREALSRQNFASAVAV
jgi:hypothetical protein